MRRLFVVAVIASVVATAPPVLARLATLEEAQTVAENWVSGITAIKGEWAGVTTPVVGDARPLEYEGRAVGYFCPVEPLGFVAVPLLRGLAPVRAYSDEGNLDPEAVGGPSDLVRGRMAMVLEEIEGTLGPIADLREDELSRMLDADYSGLWEDLLGGPAAVARDYQQGEVLVSSIWNQYPPYNDQCPDMNCGWPSCPDYQNDHAFVGCVALAGSQIMEYWSWPPYGAGGVYSDPYDWGNMPDGLTCYADQTTQAEVDAVAELCREVGLAAAMGYGCITSSAQTYSMPGVYIGTFRYSPTCTWTQRIGHTTATWFNRMKVQFDQNRPIHYRCMTIWGGHSIVSDGWQVLGGEPPIYQYHMNYGFQDTGWNAWYTVDELPGSTNPLYDEYLVENIFPVGALGATLAGYYPKTPTFPYRYFDRDAQGTSVSFATGQYLQFLPGVVLECASGSIDFSGTEGEHLRLYSHGDAGRGARIRGGTIKLHPGAEIALH
jgi:hypothetical protein